MKSIEDGCCRIWVFCDGVVERTDIVSRCWKCMIEPAAGHSSHCPSEVGAGVRGQDSSTSALYNLNRPPSASLFKKPIFD